jgi:hypothetical protein
MVTEFNKPDENSRVMPGLHDTTYIRDPTTGAKANSEVHLPDEMHSHTAPCQNTTLHRRIPRSADYSDETTVEIDPIDSHFPLLHRFRRSLDFIGNFAKYFCFIATTNDFNLLRSTSTQIKQYCD